MEKKKDRYNTESEELDSLKDAVDEEIEAEEDKADKIAVMNPNIRNEEEKKTLNDLRKIRQENADKYVLTKMKRVTNANRKKNKMSKKSKQKNRKR